MTTNEPDPQHYQEVLDRMFQDLEDRVQNTQQHLTSIEIEREFLKRGVTIKDFDEVRRRVEQLAQLSGLSAAEASLYAREIVEHGLRRRLTDPIK